MYILDLASEGEGRSFEVVQGDGGAGFGDDISVATLMLILPAGTRSADRGLTRAMASGECQIFCVRAR